MAEAQLPDAVGDLAERFGSHDVVWWVAGGYAIDLFLGWESRPHDDVDIEMFRADVNILDDVFGEWDFSVLSEGGSAAWRPTDVLPDDVYAVWARPSPDAPWFVEIILADGDASL
ncbi:MAG: nucleotidyltransferase domain-containing protein, partial [Acidimicrobiia bacterium]